MKLGDKVDYQGGKYIIHKFKELTVIIRPAHSIIEGECIEVTPDRIRPFRKVQKFNDIEEVNNDRRD